ncbi:tyrosine kinase receptor Cad96Ca isoform X2 [Amia ocellicauda]|uniref:tyrosine kinase receptor Cad96Ca isoform X2 n=1 Tax=Amia ocellicauda TaxID=2972642 RepID=UPI0034645596
MRNTTASSTSANLNEVHYGLIGISVFTVLVILLLLLLWLKKYRTLMSTISELRKNGCLVNVLSPEPIVPPNASVDSLHLDITQLDTTQLDMLPVDRVDMVQETQADTPLQRQKTKSVARSLWRPQPGQQGPRFTKTDLTLLQIIKAGKEGVFYKARMTRGTCKGHSLFTCKISKEGVSVKRVETEVAIMRKLGHHKNVLQLLDWNTTQDPYVLVMEYVSYGTLRSFLQMHRERLSTDGELQSLFTVAAYHIALALEHLRSKMVVHCDLALRNILLGSFPHECKVAEFSLARDLTRMRSRRSSRKKRKAERVPLRWYPPEYFKHNYYSFKGDVWAFGIVLWEMQMFGTLPYPNLESSEQVVFGICSGHRMTIPENCRPEIAQMIKDCWLEPYTQRPSFSDIVRILENIVENDADYVDVDNRRLLLTAPGTSNN